MLFVWPSDITNFDSALITLRFRSALFGATSRPFLLQMTIQRHLNIQYREYKFHKTIKGELYADNIRGTGTVIDEQILPELYDTANQIFSEANQSSASTGEK